MYYTGVNEFFRGNHIKHENCIDVAFKINRVIVVPKGYKIKGRWLTIGCLNDWYSLSEEILIKNDQISKWHRYIPKEIIE